MAKKRIPRNGEHVLTTEHDGVFIVSEIDARDATVKITPVGHPNVHHVVGWETLTFLDKEVSAASQRHRRTEIETEAECERIVKSPLKGLTLRLYNPQSHQWSLNWANSKTGVIGGPPNVGEFKDGRGEFFTEDTLNDRTILTRYVWSDITSNSAHFEQSFSDDGGKTWEVNWISNVKRVQDESDKAR